MGSNSATALATQQSIKAYVDAQLTAQDLDMSSDSGTGSVDLDSETLTIAGTADEIETSFSGQTLTIGLPDDVTVSGSFTAANGQFDTDLNVGTGFLTVESGNFSVSEAADFSDTLNVDGNVTLNANVDLGDSGDDSISMNGRIDTSLLPNGSQDIGSDAYRWGDIYATNMYTGDLHMKNERGDWTLFEESDHIRIRNNATGQEFKLNMTPVEE
jgi:predicted acyltransferase (DUF342 family)